MIPSCTRVLALSLLATLAPSARADDEDLKPTTATLADVCAYPEAWRRVPFDLALLYHGPRDVYNPYYTVFEPSSYLNFAAWSADAPVYTRTGYCDDHPFFYVDRRSVEAQRAVAAMRPFTWFVARCIVRSTAQGRAWIEVLGIASTGTTLESGDLRHLVRANVLAANGELDRALLEFELARLVQAPEKFVARCRGEEGKIALAANQPERALTALSFACRNYPDDRNAAALLDRAMTQVALARQQQLASTQATPSAPEPPAPQPDPQPQATPPTPPDAKPEEKPADDAPKSTEAPKSDAPSKNDTTAPNGDASKNGAVPPSSDAPKSDDASKNTETPKNGDASKNAETPKSNDTPPNGDAPKDGAAPKDESPKEKTEKSETPAPEPVVDPKPVEEPSDGDKPAQPAAPDDPNAPADPPTVPTDPDTPPHGDG